MIVSSEPQALTSAALTDGLGQGSCGIDNGGVVQVEGVDTDEVMQWRTAWGYPETDDNPVWPLKGPPPDAVPFPGTVVGGFLEDAQRPVLGGCSVPGDDLGGP